MLIISKKNCLSNLLVSSMSRNSVGNLKMFFSPKRSLSVTIIIIILFEMKREVYLTPKTN